MSRHDPQLLVGFVGNAEIQGVRMYEWLREFLCQEATDDLPTLANKLADELEVASSGMAAADRGTIIHLGAFEEKPEGPLPAIWYIRDAEIQSDGTVRFLGRFCARDELKVDPALGPELLWRRYGRRDPSSSP